MADTGLSEELVFRIPDATRSITVIAEGASDSLYALGAFALVPAAISEGRILQRSQRQQGFEEGMAGADDQAEIGQQAAEQVSIANSIGSLRFLGTMDWQEFVETMSHVEAALRDDPSGIYGAMDFVTRDHYRHVETQSRLNPELPQMMVDVPERPDHPLLPRHRAEHRMRRITCVRRHEAAWD